ncbi:MAG: FAD-dependent oxidoreductase [Chloroflexi bacterium]|nr:MAG: FAD-dependent oxidoreductase [Chloroflexota bacterium]
MSERYDVVVVGGGNAGYCAAHAALEVTDRVLLLEKAPEAWAGGNSYFTAGVFRCAVESLDEAVDLIEDRDDARLAATDLPRYTRSDFLADLRRVTEGRCDPELAGVLVDEATDTVRWLRTKGLRFRLAWDRQSFLVDGRHRFWGGLYVGTVGGGKGLVAQHQSAASAAGLRVRYEHAVVGLLTRPDGAIAGVGCDTPGGRVQVEAGAVVLAAGGFEANPMLRAGYLGPGWDLARVRGTPYNTGEALMAAIGAGAAPAGNWSGCHSTAWDAAAPPTGDRELTNLLTRQSYPLGLIVNSGGERFVDEGADYRNYTYAKYGAAILRQPGALAFQLFDAQTEPLLRQDEYTAPGVSRAEAGSVRELAGRLGIDPDGLERTVAAYNAAIEPGPFDPSVKDGKRTRGLVPPKSNWALPLERPPFLGFAVTCGITFTFGGLRVDADARVLDRQDRPIPGLTAAGELVGGLFWHNYPGGSGLSAGAVLGRRAGLSAARHASRSIRAG